MTINLGRLEKLILGNVIPENKSEESFILAYKYGLEGDLFLNLIFQLKDLLDSFNEEERNHLMLGYALGQKDYQEVLENSVNLTKPNKEGKWQEKQQKTKRV
jgi:hypothetical protein